MLTHVHKVIHLVVGTFEQGLGTLPVECLPIECEQSDGTTSTLYRKDGGHCKWPASIMVIVRGSWPFSGREPKGTRVNCSWLVWSSSCVGCAAPYWGFGMWCQLAREPLSEWIATTRTSLLASKWTSVKNHCVIIWFWGVWSSLVLFLWLKASLLDSAV